MMSYKQANRVASRAWRRYLRSEAGTKRSIKLAALAEIAELRALDASKRDKSAHLNTYALSRQATRLYVLKNAQNDVFFLDWSRANKQRPRG